MNSSQSGGPAIKKPRLDHPVNLGNIIADQGYNEIIQLITCKRCLKRINPPLKTCVHGSAWCRSCQTYNGVLCSKTCPLFSDQGNPLLNKIILSFPVVCAFMKQGCTEKMPIKSIINHEKICDYRNIECIICRSSTVLAQFGEHIKQHHSRFVVKTNFYMKNKVKLNFPNSKHGQKLFCIENFHKYFSFRYSLCNNSPCVCSGSNHDKGGPKLVFFLSYLGKRTEASTFLYKFKIYQGVKSYYSRTEICNPFCNNYERSDPNFQSRPKVITFDLSDIFLTDYYKSGFEICITIKQRGI